SIHHALVCESSAASATTATTEATQAQSIGSTSDRTRSIERRSSAGSAGSGNVASELLGVCVAPHIPASYSYRRRSHDKTQRYAGTPPTVSSDQTRRECDSCGGGAVHTSSKRTSAILCFLIL